MGGPAASGLMTGTERDELVAWLRQRGITDEEIAASPAPMMLAARRTLGDDGQYVSARQISEQVGLDLDLLMRFQRAAGLPQVEDPDAPVFMRADGDTAVHIKQFLDLGIDPDQMLMVVRVLADGLARGSEVMRAAALGAALHPGATELQTAQATEAVTAAAAPLLGPMIQDLLLLQLRRMAETEAVNAGERAAGEPLPGARTVAAAFADLVGFTTLGEQVPPDQLERLATRLAELAREIAIGPVRFIKTIGDAVMFVSKDPAALLDALLGLLERARADDTLPRLRIGMAYGAAVSRAGDWFGSPINTASRVTAAARPSSVLVTGPARDAVGDDPRFRWSVAGARQLKGIREPVPLFRARRADVENG